MTRLELLRRLTQLQDSGENMSLSVVLRVNRQVPDKRRRPGYRYESIIATLDYAASGALSINSGREQYGELSGRVRADYTGKWH